VGENEAFLSLQDGSMLTARLVVGADGANSWLRNKADIPLTFWDYHHHALVATIRTEEPHRRWRVRRSTATGFWRSCR
jgi:2-octaprenylphenol hydroxylase